MADDEDITDDAPVGEDQAENTVEENVSAEGGAPGGEASDGIAFEDIKDEQSAPQPSYDDEEDDIHTATDLEPVFDVPVTVQAVLGKSYLEVSQLLKLGPGAVVELDRKVGEAIDIYVNDRLVARGEVVLLDESLGVTMTEIIKGDRI